ncbi:MAG: hypothetical protein VZQ49_06995, partial [Methanobrevibacter sp.]|nr:hypothetical protein [Methanobrevibacter sp.]
PQNFMPAKSAILLNFVVIAFSLAIIIFLLLKFTKIIQSLCIIVLLSMSVIGIKNIAIIQHDYSLTKAPSFNDELEPIFHLSKNGKNVIVLMQDRCFSPFIG